MTKSSQKAPPSTIFRYETSYRFYSLAKIGFALAYLWYVTDFFRIHIAVWDRFEPLLSDPSAVSFSGMESLDQILRPFAVFLNAKAVIWIFLLSSPLAAGLFLWAKRRWLQFFVGLWISFSLFALSSLVGFFISSADIWLNYAFLAYSLTALVSTNRDWENCEPGLESARWRSGPAILSTYACLIVVVEFSVYFYAGVNKLIFGWTPWITGTALQNLAYDSSMHDFARGIVIPYWLSLILCYVTLFQRLVVPFGFFFAKTRLWSVLILGTMHIGYAILMNVNLFPLVGLSALLMVIPPASKVREQKKTSPREFTFSFRGAALGAFLLWILCEPVRLDLSSPYAWENKFMLVPSWKMFADGGVSAGGTWRVVLNTSDGERDITDLALQPLPHLWRDRFYIDSLYHDLLQHRVAPGSSADRLLQSALHSYRDHQLHAHASPEIRDAGFDIIYRDSHQPSEVH